MTGSFAPGADNPESQPYKHGHASDDGTHRPLVYWAAELGRMDPYGEKTAAFVGWNAEQTFYKAALFPLCGEVS